MYIKLQDAESLVFADGRTTVTCPTEYLGWQAEQIQHRGIARVWNAVDDLRARVNHGRWLADCRSCGSGMFTHPAWRIACCSQCGAVYRSVVFPENIEDITRVLLVRPRLENQNWYPGDSVLVMKAENFLHGIRT